MRELTEEELKNEGIQNKKYIEFRDKLINLINEYSLENITNTPDFIIADCMINAYIDMNKLNSSRDRWYRVHLEPSNKYFEKEEGKEK